MDTRFLEYGVFVPKDSLAIENKTNDTDKQTFSWGRVGGKWVKIGADGKPMDPPKPPPPPSDSTTSRDLESTSGRDDFTSKNYDSYRKATKDGTAKGRVTTGRSTGSYATMQSSWETPPPTSIDSCEYNERETDENGEDGGDGMTPSSRTAGYGSNRSLSYGSAADRDSNSGSNHSIRLDEDAARTHQDGGAGGPSGSATKMSSFPGNRDDAAEKEFGEDVAGAGGDIARGSSAGGGSGAASDDAACVGERAVAGGGSSEKKSRHKRTGSGSSNTANSPRKDGSEKVAVETRDVACQWDGSEMGDGSDLSDDDFPQVQLPNTPDCNALMAVLRLYDHARLENKRLGIASSRPGWGVDENIENWDGVYLDTEDRIVALDVDGDPDNRQAVLIGPLPVELAGMDHLEQLTMRRHRFKGRIPAELGRLVRLTHLNLSNCRLIGFIPPEFGDLVNLVVLNLSWNFLSGDLPPELGKLTQLEELLLNSNAFSGAIPPELGKLKKLQRFNAGHNIGISGTLPPELCRLTQLILLDLRHNKITGRIPPLFGRLTNLRQLWLQNNQLTDEIPAELARLPRLQMLHLADNKLSGVVPKALRGHPRYRAFKILPGNFALGERVAPGAREIEAATRRLPSMNAMTHASAAHAQAQAQAKAQQQQGALRRESGSGSGSMSLSPGVDGADGSGTQRSTLSGDASSIHSGATDDDGSKRRSSTSRGGVGRKIRGMKRIMGKKSTPPQSPNIGGTAGYGDGQQREQSLSPVGRVLTPGTGKNFAFREGDGDEELVVPSAYPQSEPRPSSTKVTAIGEVMLGVAGVRTNGESGKSGAHRENDESSNATDSVSTVNGASPSSNNREEQTRVLG